MQIFLNSPINAQIRTAVYIFYICVLILSAHNILTMGFNFTISAILISIILIVVLTSVFRYNAFLSMLTASLLLAITTLPLQEVIPSIMLGFGNTMKSIGLIIILGIMLGLILDKTGATHSIAKSMLRLTGKEHSGLAIHLTGFVTGVPIFCDSGFIVLHGINRSLVHNTGKPMIFMATVLAAGLYSVHCLIPPHPGATAAAGIMGADIGKLIMIGIPVALFASLSGFFWARYISKNVPHDHPSTAAEYNTSVGQTHLPAPSRSFLPIIVPLILLSGRSIALLIPHNEENVFLKIVSFTGEPVIALIIGIILAISLYEKINLKSLNELFDLSIEKSGQILALTAAGGIFGNVIKMTGAGEVAGNFLAKTELGLFIPFLIAAFLKTAQGSSTVAIMTTASILAPMLSTLNINSETGIILATLSMGAGSMIVSHTNDSYFWVITKFSEMEPKSTLRVYTTTSLVMGITAFLIILFASVMLL
jgi:GntP family gluconate:H+ symporter